MIDPSKMRIISNYVLVKPEKQFETYQFAGKETGILASTYKYDEKGNMVSTEMEHISVKGTVYAVPGKLVFNAEKVWDIQDNSDFRRNAFVKQPHVQHKIDSLRTQSVQFNTPMELQVGDEVYFEYLAYQLSEVIDTIEGKMLMIKYDMLILAIRDKEIKMLNGFILVENDKQETEEVASGITGTTTNNGIALLQNREEKKIRNRAQGTIIADGEPCGCYLDFRGYSDGNTKKGDKVLYDPRFARELEFGLHRIFSEKHLLRIQRKDVYAVLSGDEVEISYI